MLERSWAILSIACGWYAIAGASEVESLQLLQRANSTQAQSLAYRERATSEGRVFLSVIDDSDSAGPNPSHEEGEHRIWFSGERLRFDLRSRTQRSVGDWERYVVDGSRYRWIPRGEFEGVVAPSTELAERDGGVIGHFHLYHPRLLGMGHNSESTMQLRTDARFVGTTFSAGLYKEVAEDSVNGIHALRIVRRTSFPPAKPDEPPIPGEFVMWFAPEAGYSLLRAELREYAKKTNILSVENKLEQFPPSGVWFPRTIIRETKYGDKVTRRQVITIQEAEFGRAPDDAVFTVAGMDLPNGKRVSDRYAKSRPIDLVSDGAKMVEIRGPSVQPATAVDGTRGRTWLLTMNAVVLATLSLAFFLRMLKRRRANSELAA